MENEETITTITMIKVIITRIIMAIIMTIIMIISIKY